MQRFFLYCVLLTFLSTAQFVQADNQAPWGHSKMSHTQYQPQKVVYDVTTDNINTMAHVLNRASHLSKITDADPFAQSIVLVLHGASIKFFAIENTLQYETMLKRAQSLTQGETLTIKMCQLAAENSGYQAKDIHGFVEMVPMGDAEIIRLQHEEGHAYMQ